MGWTARNFFIPSIFAALLTQGSAGWLMCPREGLCNHHGWQHWHQDPKKLGRHARAKGRPWGDWLPPSARGFVEGHWLHHPPTFKGKVVRLESVASFVADLLENEPFGGNPFEVPWIDFNGPGMGKVVAISQRQLAYLVANSLMGNTIPARDGLAEALRRCSSKAPSPKGYLFSLLSFLAVLSQELAPGDQGNMLVGMTPGTATNGWTQRLVMSELKKPTLCEQEAGGKNCGLADFMAGGTDFQAVTDIAGEVVGGGAELCDLACSQDESLVQFYSEALAFAFFAGGGGRLPVPWTLLGARRYMRDLSGQSGQGAPFFSLCGNIRQFDWLNDEIVTSTVDVPLDRSLEEAVPRSAFVAVASKCAGCSGCDINDAVQNKCRAQRHQLDEDVALWYQAYEPNLYNSWVREAFKRVVRRIGTGPWGAGVWYGDSQQYFLTTWLATSLLSSDIKLDYYVYSNFCENPGNQCYVLGNGGCRHCIRNSSGNPYVLLQGRCGVQSAQDMVWRFQGTSAESLYSMLKHHVGNVDLQVFDLLGHLPQPPKADKKIIKKPMPPTVLGMIEDEHLNFDSDAVASPLRVHHGLCLDAPEPYKVGSVVHMWKCHKGLASQQWVYNHATKQIRNGHGVCLDAAEPHKKNGQVHMWKCDHENPNQRWLLDPDTGHIRLERHHGGFCLHAKAPRTDGGLVKMWPCETGNRHQHWMHHEQAQDSIRVKDAHGNCLDSPHAAERSGGGEPMVSLRDCSASRRKSQRWHYDEEHGTLEHDGQCLNSDTPDVPGSPVIMKGCDPEQLGQQWDYDAQASILRSRHGICLDTPEPGGEEEGLHMWWCFTSLRFESWFRDDRAGLIRNRHGYCLDAPDPYIKGSKVHMWRCQRNLEHQHWHWDKTTKLIRSQYGSCLESPDPYKLGGKVQIAECTVNEKQQWEYDDATGMLRHQNGKCLDAAEPRKNGGLVHLSDCSEDVATEQWV